MSFFKKRPPQEPAEEDPSLGLPPLRTPAGVSKGADPKTVVVSRMPLAAAAAPRKAAASADFKPDENTRLVGGGRAAGTESSAGAPVDPMADPVVGWLVILQGPGRGAFRKIGLGANTLGRDKGQRIVLDFGDDQISRSHAVITYDPKSRRFFVSPGEGSNLVYLKGEPVLVPCELKAGDDIAAGDTQLRFVPFCGPDFSWA